jgi:hypothetical protein
MLKGDKMTRIYLVDKSIHKTTTKSEVIATGQSTAIPLDQRLMAKFEIHPEQVSSIVRVGNNAVVHLIDGTQVVLGVLCSGASTTLTGWAKLMGNTC